MIFDMDGPAPARRLRDRLEDLGRADGIEERLAEAQPGQERVRRRIRLAHEPIGIDEDDRIGNIREQRLNAFQAPLQILKLTHARYVLAIPRRSGAGPSNQD